MLNQMTPVSLLKSIYENRDVFFIIFKEEMAEADNKGAFVFYPEDYGKYDALDDVPFHFYPLPRLRRCIEEEGHMSADMENFLRDFNFELNFLIVIIEPADETGPERITYVDVPRVGLN
jgi:hypothetical protein